MPRCLVWSRAWVIVCVEFCMFFLGSCGFRLGSLGSSHPKKLAREWTVDVKLPLWMNVCEMDCSPIQGAVSPYIPWIGSRSITSLTRMKWWRWMVYKEVLFRNYRPLVVLCDIYRVFPQRCVYKKRDYLDWNIFGDGEVLNNFARLYLTP